MAVPLVRGRLTVTAEPEAAVADDPAPASALHQQTRPPTWRIGPRPEAGRGRADLKWAGNRRPRLGAGACPEGPTPAGAWRGGAGGGEARAMAVGRPRLTRTRAPARPGRGS